MHCLLLALWPFPPPPQHQPNERNRQYVCADMYQRLYAIVAVVCRCPATSIEAYFDIKPGKEGNYQYENHTHNRKHAANNMIHKAYCNRIVFGLLKGIELDFIEMKQKEKFDKINCRTFLYLLSRMVTPRGFEPRLPG